MKNAVSAACTDLYGNTPLHRAVAQGDLAGPGGCCSPPHTMPLNSRNEDRKCMWMSWRVISATALGRGVLPRAAGGRCRPTGARHGRTFVPFSTRLKL
jgi:hypothetical protein